MDLFTIRQAVVIRIRVFRVGAELFLFHIGQPVVVSVGQVVDGVQRLFRVGLRRTKGGTGSSRWTPWSVLLWRVFDVNGVAWSTCAHLLAPKQTA